MQSELKRLGTEPVQGEELKSRQAVLTGGYARNLETNRRLGRADRLAGDLRSPLDTAEQIHPLDQRHHGRGCERVRREIFRDARRASSSSAKRRDFLERVEEEFPRREGDPDQAELDLNRAGPDEAEAVSKTGFRIPETGN